MWSWQVSPEYAWEQGLLGWMNQYKCIWGTQLQTEYSVGMGSCRLLCCTTFNTCAWLSQTVVTLWWKTKLHCQVTFSWEELYPTLHLPLPSQPPASPFQTMVSPNPLSAATPWLRAQWHRPKPLQMTSSAHLLPQRLVPASSARAHGVHPMAG